MPRTPRPWFRFYSEAIDSQKVHELPDRLVKPWLFMLCLANVNEPRGRLPSFAKIAFKMRVKESRVKDWVSALVERRFVEPDGQHYMMHEWDDFQKDKDETTPEDPSESGRFGNHKRWHLDRGVIAPDCSYCIGANRGDASGRLSPPTSGQASGRIAEKEIEIESEKKEGEGEEEPDSIPRRNAYELFEASFRRPFGSMEAEQLRALEAEYPPDVIEYAFREAVAMNKVSLRYVQSVCESNKDGVKNDRPAQTPNPASRGTPQRTNDTRELTGSELAVLDRLGVFKQHERVSVGVTYREESPDEHRNGSEGGLEAG